MVERFQMRVHCLVKSLPLIGQLHRLPRASEQLLADKFFEYYGEVFEAYIGKDTPIGLERGINNLWTNGGILYSPPFR